MADNTTLPVGGGGDTVRDMDRAGVKTPISLIDVGGAGAESLLVRGQQTMANSLPVTLPSNQSSIPVTGSGNFAVTVAAAAEADGHSATIGATTDASATTDTGTFSLIALFKRLLSRFTTLLSVVPAALVGGRFDVNLGAAPAVVTANVTQESTQISVNGTLVTVKRAVISCSAAGANTIVAAVATKKLRVLKWTVSCSAAVNAKWQSHVAPTDITGLFYGAGAGALFSGAWCPAGHFETVAGEALDLNLSGAIAVGGYLLYAEV